MTSEKELKSMKKQDLITYIQLLESELEDERRIRMQDASDFEILSKEYESELDKVNRELVQAKGKIISQDITLTSYKDKIGIPIIIEGEEHDLYKGEQKDFVISLIKSVMKGLDKYTRSYKICESLVEANKEVGNRKNISETISKLLKSYNGMSKDLVSSLNSIGIKVVDDTKGHFRLILFDDDRYTVTISHTPSDPRCGLNATTDINKLFF